MGSKSTVPEEQKYNLDTKDDSIYFKSYPKPHFGLTITLKDDRKLGYMIYGEISNPTATIIFLPGSPGTRLFNFEPHNKINKAYGIRLIILERPGIGLSSTHSNYTFKSYANDIKQLISTLKLESYHIIGYSAGGPFACTYSSLYSSDNKLKSCHLISSVGPCNTPNAYKQMTFTNKIGWFIVLNTNRNIINWAADISENEDKPIKTLVDDFSRGEYDTEMIKNPLIIKMFLQSKYEIKAVEKEMNIKSNDKCTNRLLELYGLDWDIIFTNIKCPFYVYNGCDDKGCVPNMAKFIFENVTGKYAPDLKNNKSLNVNNNNGQTDEIKDDINNMDVKKSIVAVAVDVDDIDEKDNVINEDGNGAFLKLSNHILNEFENEWNENEELNVNNKQSELIWGKDKGHLWFFEQDLWRYVVMKILFLEGKTR